MINTPRKLFIDMFNEGLAFVGHPSSIIDIVFEDKMPPFCPVIPKFENYQLTVSDNWVTTTVANKKPTVMRSWAYYYAYAFHRFITSKALINPYPCDKDAIAFTLGLLLLNGIPIDIHEHIGEQQILQLLSHFTKKSYTLIPAISADGRKTYALSLTPRDNRLLISQLRDFDKMAHQRDLNIRFGTKENPFENINEAIKYVEFLEKEAVENDPFLNSAYNKDRYRYDIAELDSNGEHRSTGIFKIPWASMFTAHTENPFPTNSFIVTQLYPSSDDWEWLKGGNIATPDFIPLFGLKPNLSKRRFLFRGQNEEYIDTITQQPTCKPNLYRPNVESDPLPHRIKAYEMACLVTQHPLVQLLGIKGVTIFNDPFRFQLNRLGLAQHYYNKTSFLDLTSDIEVAKFFATCKYNYHNDSYETFDNEERLGVLYIYDMRLPYEFKSHHGPQLSSIGKQYIFLRSAMQSGFLLNMPENVNLHDLPNVYRIYFRHNKDISEQVMQDTLNGEKYFPKDALSQYWKTMYKAPNSEYSISLKAREMYLKLHPSDFRNITELNTALSAKGFKLGSNLWPQFPDHILSDYYENAPVLWSKFCNDIHFLGNEGFLMKKALEELVNNPEYKWAFYQ
ncbi:MAG: FRG domain-containing protein [Bacteroidales bacterium]|nr:FRG domain-containing protein [Bacteroidales bacterium]